MRKDEALEYRTTRQADPVEIKQVDQIQQPLLTKPDLQQQPLKTNPESVVDKEDLSLMEEIGIPLEEASKKKGQRSHKVPIINTVWVYKPLAFF